MNTQEMKQVVANANGRIGWAIFWLMGVPIPVLVVLYLIRGCT